MRVILINIHCETCEMTEAPTAGIKERGRVTSEATTFMEMSGHLPQVSS